MSEQDTQRPLVEGPLVEQFKQDAEKMAQHMRSQGLDPATGAPVSDTARAAIEPSEDALKAVQAAHRQDTYRSDDQYRARVEAAYAAVFAGKTKAEAERIIAGNAPAAAQQTPAQPVESPQGSPAERLAQHLENGGTVAQADVNPETWSALTADYKVKLPDGYVLTDDHVQMLHNARRSNIPQTYVDAFLREAIKE